MPRYIDAEKLEKDGWSASRTYQQDVKTMVYETKKMTDFPTADVVEVVRCRDCIYFNGAERYCDNDHFCHIDSFCSFGERRDDESLH